MERILELDELAHACARVRDYLRANGKVAHSDAYGTEESVGGTLCDDLKTRKAAQ